MAQQSETSICRVCLRSDTMQDKKGISLFQKYKDSLISDQINSIANVEINKNDGLPKKICPDCLIELEAAINFKEKCETSNTILHSKQLYTLESHDVKIEFETDHIKDEKIEETCPIEPEYLEDDFFDDTDANIVKIEKPSRAIDLKLICDDCGGSFPSKCKLRVHWKKVHMHEGLICSICKRTFKSYKAFHQHMKRKLKSCIAMKAVRVQGTGKSRLYLCNDCPYTSRRNKDMQSHLITHSGERPVKCLKCDRQFTQISSMNCHMERVHGVYKVEITCQFCGKFVRGRHSVYRHLQRHNATKAQCDVCKKEFTSKKYLNVHMIRHTGIKSYTCEKCAKRFFTLAELCNHKRTRHNPLDIWYKCELCEYKSHRAAATRKHQAKHTETNVPCQVCGIFLENAEKLAKHLPRHSESEKKFPCPHCEKKFYKKDSVQKHIRSKHKCTMLVERPVLIKHEEDFDENIEISPVVLQKST